MTRKIDPHSWLCKCGARHTGHTFGDGSADDQAHQPISVWEYRMALAGKAGIWS